MTDTSAKLPFALQDDFHTRICICRNIRKGERKQGEIKLLKAAAFSGSILYFFYYVCAFEKLVSNPRYAFCQN